MIASVGVDQEKTVLMRAMPSVNARRQTAGIEQMLRPLLAVRSIVPWCKRTAEEQNRMIAGIIGVSGSAPAYTQSQTHAISLINMAARISWKYRQFEAILKRCLLERLHLDPRMQLHPSQVYAHIYPVDVAYAFYVVFGQGEEIPWR